MRQHRARLARRNPGLVERFPRQIEPADLRILVEVAQNIGELKRTPEMVGKLAALLGARPKTFTDRRPTALATRSQ